MQHYESLAIAQLGHYLEKKNKTVRLRKIPRYIFDRCTNVSTVHTGTNLRTNIRLDSTKIGIRLDSIHRLRVIESRHAISVILRVLLILEIEIK